VTLLAELVKKKGRNVRPEVSRDPQATQFDRGSCYLKDGFCQICQTRGSYPTPYDMNPDPYTLTPKPEEGEECGE